jgi:hypothetical protein
VPLVSLPFSLKVRFVVALSPSNGSGAKLGVIGRRCDVHVRLKVFCADSEIDIGLSVNCHDGSSLSLRCGLCLCGVVGLSCNAPGSPWTPSATGVLRRGWSQCSTSDISLRQSRLLSLLDVQGALHYDVSSSVICSVAAGCRAAPGACRTVAVTVSAIFLACVCAVRVTYYSTPRVQLRRR